MDEATMESQNGSTSWSGTGLVEILFISLPACCRCWEGQNTPGPDLMAGKGPCLSLPQAQRAGAASQKAVLVRPGVGGAVSRPILACWTRQGPTPSDPQPNRTEDWSGSEPDRPPTPSLFLAHVARWASKQRPPGNLRKVKLGPSRAEHLQPATSPNWTTSMHRQLSMEQNWCRRRL